jgi:hypothetical protein
MEEMRMGMWFHTSTCVLFFFVVFWGAGVAYQRLRFLFSSSWSQSMSVPSSLSSLWSLSYSFSLVLLLDVIVQVVALVVVFLVRSYVINCVCSVLHLWWFYLSSEVLSSPTSHCKVELCIHSTLVFSSLTPCLAVQCFCPCCAIGDHECRVFLSIF